MSLLLIVLYIALPFIMGNDIHRLDNDMAYTRQNQKLTLYSRYKKGYGKFERQINEMFQIRQKWEIIKVCSIF